MRFLLGSTIILFQIAMMINARFVDARYFSFAPHDSQNEYQVDAVIDGKLLNDEAFYKRYRIKREHINPRAISHIRNILLQYENTYGKKNQSEITIKYQTNGGPMKYWRWSK